MMKELLSRVLVFIFACAIAMAVSFAHAEEPNTTDAKSASQSKGSAKEILTLKEFLRRVLKNNREILIKEKELEIAKWNERAAWSSFLPSVELSLTKTESLKKDPTTHEDENGNVVQDPPGPSFLESLGTYNSELEVRQNFFNGFIDVSRLRANQLKFRQAEYALNEARSKVIKDAIIVYTKVIGLRKYLQLSEVNLKRRKDNLDIVKLHYAHGEEDQGSVLLCQANLELAETNYRRYQRQYSNALFEVKELMADEESLEQDIQIDLSTNLRIEREPEPLNYQPLIEAREEYVNAVYEEEFAHDQVRTAQASFLPTLDLTATGTNESGLDFGRQQQWEMKLELKVPLFQGGNDYFTLQGSRNTWFISKINKQSIYKTTYKKLREAYYNYDESVSRYYSTEVMLRARRVKSAVVSEKYRAGLTKFDSWDASEYLLNSEESDYIDAYREAFIAQFEWWQLSGKGFDHLWK